jgi:predicted GTPase
MMAVSVPSMQGDVKSNQVELYKHLKEKTSTPIIVAFNRVDQRFDRNSRPELLQQGFFARLKANAAEKLGCDEKDVFYVALEPGHPHEFPELQGAGVLGFDDFMNEVRRRVRDST